MEPTHDGRSADRPGPRWSLTARGLAALALLMMVVPARGDDVAPSLERGLRLFERNCVVCHGETGRGDGVAAPLLDPRPRDFGSGEFRIVSTRNSMPHDEDLMRTIARGLPGTAMPAWGHLPERDLRDLVSTVRHFMLENRAHAVMERLGHDRARAMADVLEVLDPGERLELDPEPPRTPERVQHGRDLFEAICARCHDVDGRARERLDLVTNEGRPSAARDFTRGVFKGGAESAQLARRILLGMPGSPMPAMRLPQSDVWDIVHYLQTMIEPGATERLSQRRQTLVALRVRDRLDEHMHLDDWDRAPRSVVSLMPMVWRRQRPEAITFRALHDGVRLALRLTWDDPTRDEGIRVAADGPDGGLSIADDGVAVQLSHAFDPPFFGMGSRDDEVRILEWRAGRQERTPGLWASLPVLSPRLPDVGPGSGPHRADGSTLSGSPLAADAAPGPVHDLRGSGPGELRTAAAAREFRGRGLRTAGGWDVILYCELAPESLEAGDVVSVAFAVWDASTGDRRARKSISIWQHLLLQE